MISLMSKKQRIMFWVLCISWLLGTISFWTWWPSQVSSLVLYIPITLALFYINLIMPAFFLLFLGNSKRPNPKHRIPDNMRVAMITPTVPGSESIEVVERQLRAMTRVKWPHNAWLLVDGKHSDALKELCIRYGVKYFSRHDAETWGTAKCQDWNRSKPPFKAKTKAGNINAWLDAFGRNYTHFTQLDIDHRPNPNYLLKVLPYFDEASIAWVQAPSVYGNLEHWSARGAAEQERTVQGVLQPGFYGFSKTPFIIGSHCTYKTRAILEIGGFQPTRAEDHLDTVYLASRGYQGVYIPEVIAVGDGPETFVDYCAQQFAWAYSMTEILMFHTPKLFLRMKFRAGIQFLFAQTWYSLSCISALVLCASPMTALLMHQAASVSTYRDFIFHSTPYVLIMWAIYLWSRPWRIPKQVGLTWRSTLLQMALWAVVLNACVQAVLRVKKPYMITPKGQRGDSSLPISALAPYILITALSALVITIVRDPGAAKGYYIFAMITAVSYGILSLAILIAHWRDRVLQHP